MARWYESGPRRRSHGPQPSTYDVAVDPLADATDGILRAGRRLGARGLISAGEGNLSVRLDADRLLTTPTGLRKDELTPDDLVVVWIDHPDREAVSRSGHGPSSDLAIHLAVHRGASATSVPSPTPTCRHPWG